MPNKSHFHPLPIAKDRLIGQILRDLSHLQGLIYLFDHQQPIIAFCPRFYVLSHLGQLQYFSQTSFNQYQCNQNVNKALFDLLKITELSELSRSTAHSCPQDAASVSFQGGYAGFVGYDYAAAQTVDAVLTTSQPELFVGYYDYFIQQQDDEWGLYCCNENLANDILAELIPYLTNYTTNTPQTNFQRISAIEPRWSYTQYEQAIQQVQNYIRAGDCYQINLTQEFLGQAKGSLLSCADALWSLTQAPYAGYLKINDYELLSCSPELFLEFNAHGQVKTRPIKGTRPRHDCPEQDQLAAQMLLDSVKDQAENVMIVDLLRNDLSVFAQTGTVKTPKLFEVESFQQVHHLVSEVLAQLKPECHPFEVLMNALPGGSITGAPKKRAMQIITELEVKPRGAYCGSMGYFNQDGSGRWNILIRSIQKMHEDVSVWAGGGITIASDAAAEYQECLDKVSAIVALLNQWPLHDSDE